MQCLSNFPDKDEGELIMWKMFVFTTAATQMFLFVLVGVLKLTIEGVSRVLLVNVWRQEKRRM